MTALQGVGLVAAYLIGAIPTGYWLGKAWKGIDVRQHGSGNLGATNVFRVLGKEAGALTLAIDILKGWAPVFAAKRLFPGDVSYAIAVGLATIIGHTASVFVRFRGGKGVATSAGVFLALLPLPSVLALAVFAMALSITQIVSISSMVSAGTLALAAWWLAPVRALAWMATAIAVFVIWKHRANIQRLSRGTEPKISWNRENAS